MIGFFSGVTLFVGLMKIEKGTGGPVRLLAVVDENAAPDNPNSAAFTHTKLSIALASLIAALL